MSIYLTSVGQTHFEHKEFEARKIERFNPKSVHVHFGDKLMIFSATETGIADATFLAEFFGKVAEDLMELRSTPDIEDIFEPEEAEA